MSRFAYINGKFVPHSQAHVHFEDRGYQFGDSIYEIAAVVNGKVIDEDAHLKRLDTSLKAVHISLPLQITNLKRLIREIIELNRYKHGYVYIQVTRGVAPRGFPFPKNVHPSIVLTMRPMKQIQTVKTHEKGVRVMTVEDERWARVNIKTTNLMPAVLAKQLATENGAFEAIFVRHGIVMEGSSANIFAVIDGILRTHPLTSHILGGITRERILSLCTKHHVPFEEKAFTLEEFYQADEAFITSANVLAIPIIQVNETKIGNGNPGPLQKRLQDLYFEFMQE